MYINIYLWTGGANGLCAHDRVILFIRNSGNKHQINLEWTHKQFITTKHRLFYFLHDATAHKWRSKRRFSHIGTVPHLVCLHSGDDVTITWPTRQISISFKTIFTTGRVWNMYVYRKNKTNTCIDVMNILSRIVANFHIHLYTFSYCTDFKDDWCSNIMMIYL